MSYLGISKKKLEKTIVLFEVTTVKFVKMKKLIQIKKFKSRTKNDFFAYFWAAVLKNYFHIWNHHPRTYWNAEFLAKQI